MAKNRFERHGEPQPDGLDVVRTREWDLHRLLMLATGALNRTCDLLHVRRAPAFFFGWCLPDPQIAWFTTLRGMLLARDAGCIYASCSPFSAALSACIIKNATGTPLVLDFRDAWALNPHANRSRRQLRIIGRLERWVLRTCDALILNTPGAERIYRRRYPEFAGKMRCIPNGFDRLNVPESAAAANKFSIMHFGDFYRSRTPDRLLQALAQLGNRDIEFVQVGPMFESYARFKDIVPIRVIDRVPHVEAMKLMQSASVLYLCQGWEAGVTDYVAVASKTYEYLATGLPILADCPPGDNADIVRQYASRAWVVTSADISSLASAIAEAYDNRHAHRPTVSPAFMDTFSRERLAGMLAGVLDDVAKGPKQIAAVSPRTTTELR